MSLLKAHFLSRGVMKRAVSTLAIVFTTLYLPGQNLHPGFAETGFAAAKSDCNQKDTGGNSERLWYADLDSDGFGDPGNEISSCNKPTGFVENKTDCDDDNSNINPDLIWYADFDGDGFGDASVSQTSCPQPEGYVKDNTDCDDRDPGSNPQSDEIDDDKDNNCDGNIDEGIVTGWDDDEIASAIIYPNAVNDLLRIKLRENEILQEIVIVSIYGKKVKTIYNNQSFAHINTSDLIPGIYFLLIKSRLGSAVHRIIKN